MTSEIKHTDYPNILCYTEAVVMEASRRIAAEDEMMRMAAHMLTLDAVGYDRTHEANLLGHVAEQYCLTPEDIVQVIDMCLERAGYIQGSQGSTR